MMNSLIREEDVAASLEIPFLDYGIDFDGPIADEEIGSVEVPETLSPLDDEVLQDFLQYIDIDSVFEDFGFQYYVECKQLLENML